MVIEDVSGANMEGIIDTVRTRSHIRDIPDVTYIAIEDVTYIALGNDLMDFCVFQANHNCLNLTLI
jgi:hypothetical protein